jgi:hypothetical protein
MFPAVWLAMNGLTKLIPPVLYGVAGLLIGAVLFGHFLNRHDADMDAQNDATSEAVQALCSAAQLNVDLKIIDSIHHGDTNVAMRLLADRINSDVLLLAAQRDNALCRTNTFAALNLAVAYRKSNAWVADYEHADSQLTREAREFLAQRAILGTVGGQ